MPASLVQTLQQPFVANAVVAGTAIAAIAGLVGFFLVTRGQVFTGDALGHVAFAGAAGALAFGLDLRVGLFAATVGAGVLIGALGRRGRADDVVIGNVLAWVLGLGVFFLAVYTTSGGAGNGTAGITVLFGSIFGLTTQQSTTVVVVAIVVAVLLLLIARPLLFSSLDPEVAGALGVPARWLGILFLALAGVTAGEATQAVGALLLLGLLSAPAATAQRLTTRPFAALPLSAVIAVADTWAGLALSLAVPVLPPSFSIIAVASGAFALAIAASQVRQRVLGARAA